MHEQHFLLYILSSLRKNSLEFVFHTTLVIFNWIWIGKSCISVPKRQCHEIFTASISFTSISPSYSILATELYCITDSHTVPISRGFQIISLKILSPLHGYKSNMFNTCSIFLWAFCHLYFLLCPFSSWYGRCIFFIGNTNCFQSWFWSFRPRGQLSNKVMR